MPGRSGLSCDRYATNEWSAPRSLDDHRSINALAETIIGLYKTELIRRRGPGKGLDDVEYATLEWVDWFNHRRLLEPIGHVPPAEFEDAYYREEESLEDVGLNEPSLR